MNGQDDQSDTFSRRRLLAQLGTGAVATAAAGCLSVPSTETSTTSPTTESPKTTTETDSVERLPTTQMWLWIGHAEVSVDRLLVGDSLGGKDAESGHKWVLAPIYIDVVQSEEPDVTLPPLENWRLKTLLGDKKREPARIAEIAPSTYELGETEVRKYPMDGTPDGVNDDSKLVFPKFGMAFHMPENVGYELQLLGEDGEPIVSMVGDSSVSEERDSDA